MKIGGIHVPIKKSSENAMLSGVLGGIGEYLKVDPTVLRVVFVFLVFAGGFPLVLFYMIGAILLPEANTHSRKDTKDAGQTKEAASEITEEDWSDF